MVTTYSGWHTVDLARAPADAPAAFCADLGPEGLLAAYRRGLFPMPAPDEYAAALNEALFEDRVAAGEIAVLGPAQPPEAPYEVAWWSPDPRPVITVEGARLGSRLARRLRNRLGWSTSADRAFARVVEECAQGRPQQWLGPGLRASLRSLHRGGWAHSAEVWDDGGELIGGVFGIRIGPVLSLDSMFNHRTDAARVAVADLAARFAEAGGELLDAQWDSPHIRSLGAEPIPRARYLAVLGQPAAPPSAPSPLPRALLPAGRLAGRQREPRSRPPRRARVIG
ncbi:leucyl/phenylalanyl-tRNA--protein transferase [Kitasatospora sp. NPDC050543]|uniref:leucyl/phenylalanyl-tRNA--protein transferase n=1 Tax=Kitasatospora sp. NPDC050543 TaxID=3364054 RepID=UPI0037A0A110